MLPYSVTEVKSNPRHGLGLLQYALFFTLLLVLPSTAQDQPLKFERFSIEDGLSYTSVREITQDKQGFLWMITPDGVNRYDGYKFHNYRHDPYDATSLTANSQNTIHVGHSGTVWIGNFDGLCRYNPLHDNFVRYQHVDGDSTTLWQNYTTAIYEDRDSVLWVGTSAVLNRLDRRSGKFKHYVYDGENPFSYINFVITSIIEDPRPGSNRLLIGTRGAGMVIFDKDSEKFTYLLGRHPKKPHYLRQYSADLIAMTKKLHGSDRYIIGLRSYHDFMQWEGHFTLSEKQTLLISSSAEEFSGQAYDFGYITRKGSEEILWQYQPKQGRHMGGVPKNRLQISTITLPAGQYSLHYKSDDSHSTIKWNSLPPKYPELYGVHISRLSVKDSKAIASLQQSDFMPELLSSGDVSVLYHDNLSGRANPHEIWVGTRDKGLNKLRLPPLEASKLSGSPYFDMENCQITTLPYKTGEPGGLPGKHINSVFVDHRSDVWIGTPAGLTKYSQDDGRINHYSHDPTNSASLNANSIHHIIEDHSHNLWIATPAGVNKLNRHKHQFLHFAASQQPDRHQRQLQKSSIRTLYEDFNGNLWVASDGGGLSKRDAATGLFHHYRGQYQTPPFYSSATIKSIIQLPDDPNGHLWIGTAGDGLWRFDPGNETIEKFRYNRYDSTTIAHNIISVLHVDDQQRLWIGTEGNGISLLNEDRKTFTRFPSKTVNTEEGVVPNRRLRTNEVWAIENGSKQDSQYLWFGLVGGGLSRFNTHDSTFKHIPMDRNSNDGTNSKTITDLYLDRDDILWIGTYSGGLNRYDSKSGTLQHFTVRDGLSNNMVTAIEEDDKGALWISTSSGLSVFDKSTHAFKTYDVNDGLQSSQFNISASFKLADGRLLFGGINGFNCFDPDSIKINREKPPVLLTDFKVLDKSVFTPDSKFSVAHKAAFETKNIDLHHSDNFFSFEFVALDYTNPARNQYAYQLEGFDPDWIYSGERRYAGYTNLDPGDYVFRVKACNSDGVWNDEGIAINVRITPPFWRTWWFYSISALLILLFIWLIHSYRVKVKIREMRQIERVRKKAAADFHDELGHKLTKISLFSEIVMQRLNGSSPETAEYVDRINDISGSLYHGMRDFLWTLDPSKDSLFEVAIKLKDFGDEFFDRTGVQFRATGINESMKNFQLSMDWKRHLLLIFKEGMNNILRHAECHNATLSFAVKDDILHVELIDDGRGYGEDGSDGNGIRNMKGRAAKLESELDIFQTNGHGTTITFRGNINNKVTNGTLTGEN